jgi:hypothetical protein
VRRACFVYIGFFPERFDVPGAVFAPVLRGIVFVPRGVTGPPERRLICFVRAMIAEEVDGQDGRVEDHKAPLRQKSSLRDKPPGPKAALNT